MTVRVYKSTDTSAPTLSGTAGAVIALLDAILVNGYGSQTAAGWAKEFSGTNKAAYRAATGNRFRLRVDDSGTTSARVVGYETMSDVDTGTGDFPTALQFSGGMYIYKSSTANSTARPWLCIASSKAFYLFTFANSTTYGSAWSTSDGAFFFGDLISFFSGTDNYATLLCGNNAAAASQSTLIGSNGSSNQAGNRYIARSYTQTGTAVNCGQRARCYATTMQAGAGVLGSSTYGYGRTYPDPISGSLLMAPIEVTESLHGSGRAKMPGMWGPEHSQPAAHLDTFSGSGSLAGKTFLLIHHHYLGTGGALVIETSDGW